MLRLAGIIILALLSDQAALALQSGGVFGWLRRADPKIETFVFTQHDGLAVGEKRIGLLPFPAASEAEPAPPDFALSLLRALLEDRRVDEVRKLDEAPWEALPEWRKRTLDKQEQVRAAVGLGPYAGFGSDRPRPGGDVFRTARQGLTMKVSLRVLSTEDGRVLWYGRKRAEWIRSFPTEDCLLRLARSFVEGWPSGETLIEATEP